MFDGKLKCKRIRNGQWTKRGKKKLKKKWRGNRFRKPVRRCRAGKHLRTYYYCDIFSLLFKHAVDDKLQYSGLAAARSGSRTKSYRYTRSGGEGGFAIHTARGFFVLLLLFILFFTFFATPLSSYILYGRRCVAPPKIIPKVISRILLKDPKDFFFPLSLPFPSLTL